MSHPLGLILRRAIKGKVPSPEEAWGRVATGSRSRDSAETGACRKQASLPRGHHSEHPTSGSACLVIFGTSA